MNEKEKEAIEDSKNLIEELKFPKYEDFVGRLCYKGKPIENILLTLNKRIEKQDKMIEYMAKMLVEDHEYFFSKFDDYTAEDFIKHFEKKVMLEKPIEEKKVRGEQE